MSKIYPQIIKAIQNDSLVFFIGAGFSRGLGFPDWKGLLKDIIEELQLMHQEYGLLIQMLDAKLMTELEVLEKIQNHRREALAVLAQTFHLDNEKMKKLEKHRKLWRITNKFVTTNYDRALESANPLATKVVHNNGFYPAQLNTIDNYVFKLHGCIEDPTQCILFESDYNKLYGGKSQAVDAFRKFISDKTIIFLGFSLADPYVKQQFDLINSLYDGMQKKHYIITTSDEEFGQYVEPIRIGNWDEDLDNIIDNLISIKESTMEVAISNNALTPNNLDKEAAISISKQQRGIRAAILVASPIDKQFNYDFSKITDYFGKLEITIEYAHLSIEALNNLEGYDYVFVFTHTAQNNKIFVEDFYFKAKPISLLDFEQEIFDDKIKGVFLFLDKKMETVSTEVTLPMVIKTFDNGNLRRFVFAVFKKANITMLQTESTILNVDRFVLTQIPNGDAITVKGKHDQLPKQIDPKNLKSFVGRTNDLEILVRKVRELKQSILTVKGSGGLGKTTIVKKLSVEFANRNYFGDGIFFIDCENIVDFQTFEYKVAKCFGLETSIDMKAYIKLNGRRLNSLVILDNFESLLYLEKEDTEKIKDLVAFICDYATLVVTSREWVGFEFEEGYELRSFTTDEAVDLFRKHYKYNISEDDLRVLRSDILENLLNNNPLAIKIITKNIPKTKNLLALKEDLERDFFSATQTEGFEDVFLKEADSNIERSKSLYQSINYSYSKLSSREKLAFELLCLFPDGIHMETFKAFFERKEIRMDINRVTDRDITSLENKSLVEITQGFLRLQSIVGRFADYHFNKRENDIKSGYFKKAYQYNYFLMNHLDDVFIKDPNFAIEIFDDYRENYFKCLDYIDKFESDMEMKLLFIGFSENFIDNNDQRKRLEKLMTRLKGHFSDVENGELLIDIYLHISKFYNYSGEFADSFEGIVKLIPLEKLGELPITNVVNENVLSGALHCYNLTGREYDVMKHLINRDYFSRGVFASALFYLGSYEGYNILSQDSGQLFFNLEAKFNTGMLEISMLEEYLADVHERNFIEIMQVNYLMSKMGYSSIEGIKKLVVVSPYTQGLQQLMMAFLETDADLAIHLYIEAINNLEHVKYYHTEAIFFFSKYLKKINSPEYQKWFELGNASAKERHYRYLIHCFECLVTGEHELYDEHKSDLPGNPDIKGFVRKNGYTC